MTTQQHDWTKSTLGHGETMCRNCFVTNREASVLGCLDTCDRPTSVADRAACCNCDQDCTLIMNSRTERIVVAGVMATIVLTVALAFVLFPPSRPCPAGSLERLLTRCEVRP